MAGKGGKGTTRNGRDSRAKRLGVKLYAGQMAQAGSILVRQHGTRYLPGINVRRAVDDTLYAVKTGQIKFRTINKRLFTGLRRTATEIRVEPA